MCLGLIPIDAAAWGPRAQRAITFAAIQMIRKHHPSAFKTKNNNYEEDVLNGAVASHEILAKSTPLNNDKEAVAVVASEIQLLREVRQYGTGSYFAFRMGSLGALVSDLILPYGMAWSANEMRLREQIEADIDASLDQYGFTPSRPGRQYVRNVQEYFQTVRRFYADNKRIIADDYTSGQRFNGFLRKGGQAYFGRAIEAAADVWYTVLRIEGDPSDMPPSPPIAARYFVNEIGYLLNEKRNIHQANKTYANFVAVNPGLMELYEEVGDLYCAYGTDEAKERGVREWRIAHSQGGPHRRRVAEKLSAHYLRVGEAYLEAASQPGASERALPNALEAFTQSLEFDRGSEMAAERLNETNVKIIEREERRELTVSIIASAEKVVKEAEKHRLNKDFANAIATYKQAISLFDAIDDEFADQAKTASESIKACDKNINDVISEVIDAADEAIAAGDDAVSEHRWDQAMAAYESVEAIVSIIPGDETTHARHRKEVVAEAKRKIADAKDTRRRVEEAQKLRDAAAESGS